MDRSFSFSCFLGRKSPNINATIMTVTTTPPQTPPAIAPVLGFLLGVGASAHELGRVDEDGMAGLFDVETFKTVVSESDDPMSGYTSLMRV